jgi:uncharacterized membrane protein YebE (DUF533 family)
LETRALLEELLRASRDLARQGQSAAERKLGIPEEGPERAATVSAMGKGAAAAGLLALLVGTRPGRKAAGGALKLGGLAALGGMAYKAYQNWQAGGAGRTADPGTPVGNLSGEAAEQRGVALLRAMVAAARADGHVDEVEQRRIHSGIARLGLADSAVQLLSAAIEAPLDAAAVAAGADSMEAAAEIYLASLSVIDPDHPAERSYLDELARQLRLDGALVAELEGQVRPQL